jgi:hypothetical protein
MRVVIMGERQRSELADFKLVNDLIDALKEKYPLLWIVTASTDRGVGKLVINRLLKYCKSAQDPPEVTYTDFAVKIRSIGTLPKGDYSRQYYARNASLVDIGEEFHLFMDQDDHGYMLDLLKRVREAGLPHSTYYPQEKCGPKMVKLCGQEPR